MTIIYSSQSISGYNATPPPDDGSTGSDNEITWAKHKTKLADPIKTLSEAIDTELQTAFGKIHLNGRSAKTTTYTILTSDRGKLIDCTSGTFTVTLLAAATATNGFEITILNSGTGVITIDGNSSETINGSTTLVLQPGGWATLVTDGSLWAGPTYATAPTVTDYSGGRIVYTHDDFADSAGLVIQTIITTGTWESVGPTGSGATNIWAALDIIPTTATAVMINAYALVRGSVALGEYSISLFFRNNGSSASQGIANRAVVAFCKSDGVTLDADVSTNAVMVPLDSSNIFEVGYLRNGTVTAETAEIHLMGWIE